MIDAKEGKVLGRIDLGGAPEQGVSDGKGRVYAVIQDKANLAVIDAKAMKVTGHATLSIRAKFSGRTGWRDYRRGAA